MYRTEIEREREEERDRGNGDAWERETGKKRERQGERERDILFFLLPPGFLFDVSRRRGFLQLRDNCVTVTMLVTFVYFLTCTLRYYRAAAPVLSLSLCSTVRCILRDHAALFIRSEFLLNYPERFLRALLSAPFSSRCFQSDE